MDPEAIEAFPTIRATANRLRIFALILVAVVLYVIAWTVAGVIAGIALLILLVRIAEGDILSEVGLVLAIAALVLPPPIAVVVALVRIPTRRKALNAQLEREIASVVTAEPDAELVNLVAGLAIAAGIPAPEVVVLDVDAPNACAIGTRPRATRIVVTRGLSTALTRAQLEAVLAWEIVCIASRDIALTTWVEAFTADAIKVLGDDSDGPTKSAGIGPRGLTARFEASVLRGAATRRDRLAVHYTRNPQALLEAFEVLQRAGGEIPCVSRVTAPLWIEVPQQPFGTSEVDRGLGRSLQLGSRVDALRASLGSVS